MDVPVADETMSIAALQEAFPHENVQKHFIAWNILSRAIANNGDRDALRHASSPAAGWRALVDTYSASTLGVKVRCLQSLTPRSVKPGANPIPVFDAMIEDVRNMRANGLDIEDEVVCLLFLRALPDEHNMFRQMLEEKGLSLPSTGCVRSYGPNRRKRPTLLFLLLEQSGETADAAEKNAVISAAINKRTGRLRGKMVMVRAVAAVRVVATELHPGSQMDPHAATSARKRGTSGSSAPSGSVVSAARLVTIPISALRL